MYIIHANIGNGYSTEGQYGRIPDGTFDPLQENSQEAVSFSVSFTDPTKYPTFFVGEHGR